MSEIKLLNNTQKEQLSKMTMFYKKFYVCNRCGNVYGSDNPERIILCPECDLNKRREKKKSG